MAGEEENRLVSGTVSGFSSGIVEGRRKRRGWGEEGDIFSVFGRIFEMASGWIFPAFSREYGWERRRGEEGGNGGGDVGEGRKRKN